MKRLLALCLFCCGCASTVIDGSQFEKDCVSTGQCRPVYFGDVCKGCQCFNGAVNEQGFGKYEIDKKAITCASPPPACDCAAPQMTCTNNQCALLQ